MGRASHKSNSGILIYIPISDAKKVTRSKHHCPWCRTRAGGFYSHQRGTLGAFQKINYCINQKCINSNRFDTGHPYPPYTQAELQTLKIKTIEGVGNFLVIEMNAYLLKKRLKNLFAKRKNTTGSEHPLVTCPKCTMWTVEMMEEDSLGQCQNCHYKL